MIGSLRGKITAHLEQKTLLEVGGVGFWINTGSWQPEGENLIFFISQQIREDSNELYGFNTLEQLNLFEKLLTVSGIGPKAALNILSLGPPTRIQAAILQEDLHFLSSASGVGGKAAQKIVLELKGKLNQIQLEEKDQLIGQQHPELVAALESLGYKNQEFRPVLRNIPTEILEIDQQLKWVLKELSGR
jgi:Holliday junction DNA helicase RuvA